MDLLIKREIYLALTDMGISIPNIEFNRLSIIKDKFLNIQFKELLRDEDELLDLKIYLENKLDIVLGNLDMSNILNVMYERAIKQLT